MTPEEIRTEAIERIARVLFEQDAADACSDDPFEDWAPRYRREAAPYIDALAAAGLLPTGEQFGVGSDTTPCCIHESEHAARLDQTAHGGPLRHRWTHNWHEVAAAERYSGQDGE
ncbi:hypothetical protein IU421_13435 [Nocardia cyriacigeorgica]|uniref:hypothetical protein n=1 Tax=Nocardia cyriacigeorgica TaxID=135487 RepID=UPI001893A698|nr:hypothetical protein [Nocardia cyriacigeorgica]MBF6515284.1 hypothetical protein [Nocardia cyriacigeorgica]